MKNADVIRVWYCEECRKYQFDFIKEEVWCRFCGNKMKKRQYKQTK